jgi:endoglucanase
MKKRIHAIQYMPCCIPIQPRKLLYQHSFHALFRRLAGIAFLLAICTAILNAAPTIVEVRSAAPTVIVVVVQTDITYEPEGGTSEDFINLSGWQVNGAAPLNIYRYSIPWDELPKTQWNDPHPNAFPVTTRHRIYLRLGSALVEGQNYNVTTPYGNTSFVFNSRNTFCESIKVNQVGYSKLSTSRFANFGVFMGTGGSMTFNPLPTYQVINESSGAVVASGTAVYMGDETSIGSSANSGEHVYRLSLNAVPEGGPYFVSVVGAGRSRSFGIGDTYSAILANVTMRGMYLHRCGIALTQPYTPFTHGICHTNVFDVRSTSPQDQVVVPGGSPPMFIQGGYHDAGDMDHTEGHPVISILMLSFFESFPNRFVDNQYNIPESGNGIPDFLDEIMWGVRMWEHLQIGNPSDPEYGGVRSGWSANGTTGYGAHSAANDPLPYGTKNVQEDCTAMVAGIFAQSSRLIRPYDSTHADVLLTRAQQAWNYLVSHGNVNQPKTRFLYAALQLYLATGNSTYHNVFQAAANSVILGTGGAVWPDAYLPGNGESTCQTAHFVSYLLPHGQSTNPTLVQNLKNKILNFADTGSYMGPPPETKPYPQGVTAFLGWGSGTSQGRYADVWMYGTLFTTDPVKLQKYTNAVCQYADFPVGLNAMGMSYYTGLGTDRPNSPLDCNSYYTKYGLSDGVTPDTHRDASGNPIGNVPGIVVYGPADGPSGAPYQVAVSKKMFPAFTNLPPQRRWADGWSLVNANEFTVAETMVWNVPMYAFLYTPTGGGGGTPPAAPSGLSATAVSSSQINLSWTDNANNETGFKIERKVGAGGTYAQIATVGANVTSYNNTGLSAGTTYYYRVRANNAAGDSAYSPQTNATTSGTSPSGTTAQRATVAMTINGNLSESGWSITNTVTKPIVGSPNNTVTFGVLWDDTYLYVGARVLDGNLFNDTAENWQDDSVEIYIDGNHNHGTIYDAFDRQIVKGWNDGSFWVSGNQTNGILHAWAAISGGYSVEVAIPWSNLGISPSSGTVIGFDVASNDDDNGGLRESQVMWVGTANNWTDTSAFGDLTLTGGGEEFTSDANTIALYHFTGNYSDSSANGFHLTQSGNVTRFNNPSWMQSPSGQAARFSNIGDQLAISTVPDSAVQPGPSQTPLSIEARIYVRGYKCYSITNLPIIELSQDWDSQLMLYDNKWPASGEPIGPTVNGDTWTIIVTASQWQNAVPLNAWHKFKLTFAADGTAKCYIDNNLIATVATSVNVGRTSPWRITLGNFDGDIDEVRISKVVR